MAIIVHGAREHNLRGVDLQLPIGALTVFVGPSGSGKSSLAFDTLHAESQRRYLEAAGGAVARGANLRAPRVDAIERLPISVALDQRFTLPDGRLTVADLTEVHDALALLIARAGELRCPVTGDHVEPLTHDELVARLLRLPEGSRLLIEAPVRRGGLAGEDVPAVLDEVRRAGFSRVRVANQVLAVDDVGSVPPETSLRVVVDRIKVSAERRDRVHEAVRLAARAGQGVIVAVTDAGETVYVDRPYSVRADLDLPPLTVRLLSPRSPVGRCPTCAGRGRVDAQRCDDCNGSGLGPVARTAVFAGATLPTLGALTPAALDVIASSWQSNAVSAPIIADLRRKLARFDALGLGHLTLDREVGSLSTGELQRLRLLRQVSSPLSGVLYVLDEPAAGLSDVEAAGVVLLLRALVDQGNTVLVVEHHPAVIEAADLVVEFGPGAGVEGGHVLFTGAPAELRAAPTATGLWLRGAASIGRPTRTPRGEAVARGLVGGNLRGDLLTLPVGGLGIITGPSGAGKSSALSALRDVVDAGLRGGVATGELIGFTPERLIVADQMSLARTRRSSPATFLGVWDILRDLLSQTREARLRGFDAGTFSLNTRGGRCEACKGTGEQRVELGWLPEVVVPCGVCDGRRFHGDVREVRYKGLSADELLELPAREARALLAGHPKLEAPLRALDEVGLGYVPLGQPTEQLSGGELHRLRVARELGRVGRLTTGVLYLLDEPTRGLHASDVDVLVTLFDRLVEQGATVWVASHHPTLLAAADGVVRLGPGAGPDGGRVV